MTTSRRVRASRPKVRTGCRTCRARHIKCGEEKPTCCNCDRSGRECGGYDVVKPPPGFLLPLLRPHSEPTLVYPPQTLSVDVRSKDGYVLDYFFHEAFQDLPGSGWILSWDRLVLPFHRSEPAVLHAAIALGWLHQNEQRRHSGDAHGTRPDQLTSAFAQYGKAVTVMQSAIEKQRQNGSSTAVEVILTTCLLLFCFELLYDRDEVANMHLRNGLRILHEHIEPHRSRNLRGHYHERPVEISLVASSRMDVLAQTFVRLDANLTPLCENDTFVSPVCRRPVPNSFSSLEEAMMYIDVAQSQVTSITRELNELAELFLETSYPGFNDLDEVVREMLNQATSRTTSLESSPQLVNRMEESTQTLRRLMAALATLSSSEDDTQRMLVEMHLFIVWFHASRWRDADEMQIDRFSQQFEYIMGTAEKYFEANKAHAKQQTDAAIRTRPAFTIGNCVNDTVCTIIERSRNSTIRQRGIKLVGALDMRGVFDSAFLASYYQAVVDIEETRARELLGLPADHVFHYNEVPAEARLMAVEIAGVDGCEPMYYHRPLGRMVYVHLVDGELRSGERVFRVSR